MGRTKQDPSGMVPGHMGIDRNEIADHLVREVIQQLEGHLCWENTALCSRFRAAE